MGLDQAVRMWPTPRNEGFDAGAHRGVTDSLHSAVKAWATPTVQDNRHSTANAENRQASGRQMQLTHQVGLNHSGKLHGRWTLALMGFPLDWCDDLPPDPLSLT